MARRVGFPDGTHSGAEVGGESQMGVEPAPSCAVGSAPLGAVVVAAALAEET